MKYDAILIGFGQGAASLVDFLTGKDWKVALIEKNEASSYGGSCINIGCIPTKILEHDSKLGKDYTQAIERRNNVVKKNRTAEKEAMEQNKLVDLYTGTGSFIDNYRVKVETEDDTYELEAEHIIIDTGSEPVFPSIDGLEETENIYTSTTLQVQKDLPETLGIIGGGNIGLEFASIYQNFGSQVTVIDSAETFLEGEEPEVAKEVKKVLADKGINIHNGLDVEKVVNGEENSVLVTTKNGDEFSFDALLVAVGRKPQTDSLNLNNTDIKQTKTGGIQTDQHLQTTVEGVFAVGDVRGEEQFTYITNKDAEIVYNFLCEDGSRLVADRKNVPSSIFIDPPFSKVGLTEQEANKKGYQVITNTTPVSSTTRSDIIDDKRGLYKVVINRKDNQILGVTLFGDQSHELVNYVKLAMDNELPYTVLKNQMINHPVMTEIFNTLFDL